MSEEERYFRHPETGEILPDKRSSQKIETTLAKVALSQEMTESTIKNIERVQVANNTMLENLIRSEYNALKSELKNHDDNNRRDFTQAIATQKGINTIVKGEINKIKLDVKNHNDRLVLLENKPVKKKAAIMDKLLLALLGGGITLLVTNIIKIIEGLL